MGVALVPDSPNHCLVRREPGWPNTDAGGGGGGGLVGYFVVMQALLCRVGEHQHRIAHQIMFTIYIYKMGSSHFIY